MYDSPSPDKLKVTESDCKTSLRAAKFALPKAFYEIGTPDSIKLKYPPRGLKIK